MIKLSANQSVSQSIKSISQSARGGGFGGSAVSGVVVVMMMIIC